MRSQKKKTNRRKMEGKGNVCGNVSRKWTMCVPGEMVQWEHI